MDRLQHELKKEFQLERMILFSDAVFAIAITLLALELKIPDLGNKATENDLLHALGHLVPKFFGFLISFFLVGLYWTIHHRMFGFVINYDKKLMMLNLLFLLSIVMMPFSTGIYGEYSTPKTIHLITPVAVYVVNICFTGIMNYFLWSYLSNPVHQLSEGVSEHVRKQGRMRSLVVPTVFLLALGVAFLNPYIARYVPVLMPLIMRLLKKVSDKKAIPVAVEPVNTSNEPV